MKDGIPLYMRGEMERDTLHIPFTGATIATAVLMSGGFILCVILSLFYNFEKATGTHCGVPNYLPSISAAISLTPSAYVWRIVVAVNAAQRITTVFFHYKCYLNLMAPRRYRFLCGLCFFCELVENLCLIGLTCVSSIENHFVHASCFIFFQLCAMVFMFLMSIIYKEVHPPSHDGTGWVRKSARAKWVIFVSNIGSFSVAMYVYYRHNTYCEPGVYTIFALLEYVIVLTNVAFHTLVSLDFGDREIHFGTKRNTRYNTIRNVEYSE